MRFVLQCLAHATAIEHKPHVEHRLLAVTRTSTTLLATRCGCLRQPIESVSYAVTLRTSYHMLAYAQSWRWSHQSYRIADSLIQSDIDNYTIHNDRHISADRIEQSITTVYFREAQRIRNQRRKRSECFAGSIQNALIFTCLPDFRLASPRRLVPSTAVSC